MIRSGWGINVLILSMLIAGCSSDRESTDAFAVAAQALAPTSQSSLPAWNVDIRFPSWGTWGPMGASVAGITQVEIGADSRIVAGALGSRPNVIASGGPVVVQPGAIVSGIVAVGAVDLRDRVTVKGHVTAPSVTVPTSSNGVTIEGKVVPEAPKTGAELRLSASLTAGTYPNWDLQPGQTQTLAPGRYGTIQIKRAATLKLESAGHYYFESISLQSGGTLLLADDGGTTKIFVRNSLTMQGTWSNSDGQIEHLGIIYAGTADLAVESPLRGTLVAPKALVSVRATATAHRGAILAKQTRFEAQAKLEPVAATFLADNLGAQRTAECAWAIPPKSTGNKQVDDEQYQYDILRTCIMRTEPDAFVRLSARANVEMTNAGFDFVLGNLPLGNIYGLAAHRMGMLRSLRANPSRAQEICDGPDDDRDWVPNTQDVCAGTSAATPVDSSGCPTPLPQVPPSNDVRDMLRNAYVAMNPACNGSDMPKLTHALGVYVGNNPAEGVYLYVKALTGQPVACPGWYHYDVKVTKGGAVVERFAVAFPQSSASTVGRVVPQIPQPFVQLHASPTSPGSIGRFGRLAAKLAAREVDQVWVRVRSVSGVGIPGPWGRWILSEPQDCPNIGFECAK